MSKRARKSKAIVPSNEVPAVRKAWTSEDKFNLLKALRIHGHTDIDNISLMLPDKTKSAIRLMIHKIIQKARSVTYTKSPALNTWLESGNFDDKTQPIPQALKFISLFERHPTPQSCGGFDFKAAYEYLCRMTLGLPAIELPKDTLERLNALVKEVETEVWPAAEGDIVDYLGTLGTETHARKCYPPMRRLGSMKSDYWSYMSGQTN